MSLYILDTDTLSLLEHGHAKFEELRRAKLGVGSMDLRIAAIALDAGATVVTRNVRDFGLIPGLTTVDWSL